MRNLSDPRQRAAQPGPGAGRRRSPQVAPVAEVQARLFGELADTFAALNRDPRRAPGDDRGDAADAGGRDRLVPRADAVPGALRRRVAPARPGGRRAAPRAAADQRRARAPACPPSGARPSWPSASSSCSRRSRRSPRTRTRCSRCATCAARCRSPRPALEEIAPYQTVCNYLVYFFNPLGTHQSEPVPGGTQPAHPRQAGRPRAGRTRWPRRSRSARWTCRATSRRRRRPPTRGHSRSRCTPSTRSPAIDSRGRADCQSGQTGYPDRLVTGGRYPPDRSGPASSAGGSHVVLDGDTPGLAGGTYKSRQLGIDSLEDVP